MSKKITYAIGDVHGRADLLNAIISHAVNDASERNATPQFIFLGDICDKGPRSRQAMDIVAEALIDYEGSIVLKGNHDDLFLKAIHERDRRYAAAWVSRGGIETLNSYHCGNLNEAIELVRTMHGDHLRMFASAAPMAVVDGVVFAHAGINPAVPLASQSEKDLMWIRDDFLGHVGYLQNVVVHGHTVVGDKPVVTENRISIDTGAYESGRLTAVAIEDGAFRFFQTDGNANSVIDVEPVRLDRGLGTILDHHEYEFAEAA